MRPVCGPGDLRVRKHRGDVLCRTPRVPPLSVCSVEREGVVGGETRNLDPAAPASVSLGGAAGSPAFLPPTGIGAAGRSPHENGGTVMALQGTEFSPLQSTLISERSTLQVPKDLHENLPNSFLSPKPSASLSRPGSLAAAEKPSACRSADKSPIFVRNNFE